MGDERHGTRPAIATYVVRVRERGQMTIPQEVRDDLDVKAGDVVRLVRTGGVWFVTPQELRTAQFGDRIVQLMEAEGVSLADLLAGLDDERRAIEAERQAHA